MFVCVNCRGKVVITVEGTGILAQCQGLCQSRAYYPYVTPGFWHRHEDDDQIIEIETRPEEEIDTTEPDEDPFEEEEDEEEDDTTTTTTTTTTTK